jgi:hypothetical protein
MLLMRVEIWSARTTCGPMGELAQSEHRRMGSNLRHHHRPYNELVGQIHDRMPATLEPSHYERWLSTEPDPRDLLIPYSSEPMTMWPISTRVNKPENDDPSLLERTSDPFNGWAPL